MAKSKQKKKNSKQAALDKDILIYVYALILITVTIIAAMKLGIVGMTLTNITRYFTGTYYGVVYGIIMLVGLFILFKKQKPEWGNKSIVACLVLFAALILWAAIPQDKDITGFLAVSQYIKNSAEIFQGTLPAQGGLIGAFFFAVVSLLVARTGTYIIIIALIILSGLLMVSHQFWKDLLGKVIQFFKFTPRVKKEKPKAVEDEPTLFDHEVVSKIGKIEIDEEQLPHKKSIFMELDESASTSSKEKAANKARSEDVKTDSAGIVETISNYKLPPLNLLKPAVAKGKSSLNTSAATIKGKKLIEILGNFGINAVLVATHIGPAVTKFEIRPDSNVKVSKIAAIQDNIKMELSARDIRIESPIPGRNAVGIEIPNVETTAVKMIELIKQIPSDKVHKKLLFILGKDLMGQPVFCELDRMPHLLIAGATGSGKSVCMNTIITSFLLRTTPDEVKLLLIDPKKVEFTPYHQIPHLIGPVISDALEAARALKVIVEMMENRYEIFSKLQVRNITSYNELLLSNPQEHLQPMPYIVVIIDELADLMAIAGKEVETSIQRITQLARAAGIHLIVATQRPSTDVITGIIKANIPSRIAFAVSSGIDSRTILDHIGAERLLGYGDMLYLPIGEPSTVRLQGVYMTDEEVAQIAQYATKQLKPHFEDAFIRLEALDNGEVSGGVISIQDDPIYDEVKEYVIQTQKASTSSLQRRFGLGYNRAARMIDVLEDRGIVGPAQGSKPRDVYVKNTKEEE